MYVSTKEAETRNDDGGERQETNERTKIDTNASLFTRLEIAFSENARHHSVRVQCVSNNVEK